MNGIETSAAGGLGRHGVSADVVSILRQRDSERASGQGEFSALLAQANAGDGRTREELAREAAEGLVSTALVQPIFQRLRESNRSPAPYAPNQAERMFGSMLDALYAQRIVKSQNWGLVDRLAQRVLSRGTG
jgi:Rod binding domain-containing protein